MTFECTKSFRFGDGEFGAALLPSSSASLSLPCGAGGRAGDEALGGVCQGLLIGVISARGVNFARAGTVCEEGMRGWDKLTNNDSVIVLFIYFIICDSACLLHLSMALSLDSVHLFIYLFFVVSASSPFPSFGLVSRLPSPVPVPSLFDHCHPPF